MDTLKNNIIKLFPVLFLGLIFWSSCQKQDLDTPPVNQLHPDSIITIGELRALYKGQPVRLANSGKSLFATITMDQASGNIYKQAYIQDHTGGINVRLSQNGNLAVGDSVRISLKGALLNAYQNMLQLDSVDGAKKIIKQASGKNLEPKVVTINDILAGGYQAQLIKLENVQFINSELGLPWGDAINQATVNRNLQDCTGKTIIVRTSGYADFAGKKLPEGNGSIIAIVGQFGTTWQLYVRSDKEALFDQERCAK